MITVYDLKPRFQAVLRPFVAQLAARGVAANQVTLAALVVSLALGLLLWLLATHAWLFLLLPLWFFLRMALNAIDGMLAREHGQQSPLGAYLNELSDVAADAALYLPFVAVAPFGWASVGLVIFLAALSEMPVRWRRWWVRRVAMTGRWARAIAPWCSVCSACGTAWPVVCRRGWSC